LFSLKRARRPAPFQTLAEEEFDALCFEYGIELDDVVSGLS
jgi:hypothetical protein